MYFNQLSKRFRGFLGIIKLRSNFFKEKKRKSRSIFLRKLGCDCYIAFQVISFSCRSRWCPNNTSNAQRNWELANPLLPAGTGLVRGLNMREEPKAKGVRGQNSGCWSYKFFFFFLLVLPWLCFPVKQERNVQRKKKIFKRGRGRQWTQTWKENIIEKEKLAQSPFPTEGFHKQSSRLPLASLVFLTCFWPCRAWFAKQQSAKGCAEHLTCMSDHWKSQIFRVFTVIEHLTEPRCCTWTFECSPGQTSGYFFMSVY